MKFKTLILIFIGMIIGVFSVGYALASIVGPDYGPATPGALCLIDGDTWVFCDSSHTFGDAGEPVSSINVDELTVNTGLTMGGSLDLDGNALIVDADGDTQIIADVDDTIDFDFPAEASAYQFTGTTFDANDNNITTTGTLDVGGTGAGQIYVTEGTHTIQFCDGTYSINAQGTIVGSSVNVAQVAAQFTSEDASRWVQLGGNTTALYSTDGVSITELNDGTYGVDTTGSIRIVGGDLIIPDDGLFGATNTANYFWMADGTNYNPTSPADVRTGLGLGSGGAGDIWVDEAGDTMTGQLYLDYNVSGTVTENLIEAEGELRSVTEDTTMNYFMATMRNGSTYSSAGTQYKIGYALDNIPRHNQTGGTYNDYGAYLDMGHIAEVPHGVYAIDYTMIGAELFRNDIGISDMDAGSWNDVTAIGLKLTGWKNAADDYSGIAGDFTRYAIYSDGGDVELTDGNLDTTGTITGINVTSGADPGHTHTATSLPDVESLSTSLTAGSVVFSDGTNLAEDNTNFYWDDTNNYLGIGTTGPNHRLVVGNDLGAITARNSIVVGDSDEGAALFLGRSSTNWGKIGWDSTKGITFTTKISDSVSAHTLAVKSGKVGIRTTAPNELLSLSKSGSGETKHLLISNPHFTNGDTAMIAFALDYFSEADQIIKGEMGFVKTGNYGVGDIVFALNNDDGTGTDVTIASDEVMRIKSDGNVGIGTTGPDTKLQVVGGAKFGDDDTNYLSISDTGVVTMTGTAIRSLTLRPEINIDEIKKQAVPDQVQVGVFFGYSMPIWTEDSHEELFFRETIPGRWTEEHDIIFHITIAVADTQTGQPPANRYVKFQFDWNQVDFDEDVISAAVHSESQEQVIPADTPQYTVFPIEFVIDYDADPNDKIEEHDLLAGRLRRIDATTGDEMEGEIIVVDWHTHYFVNKMFRVPE